MRNDDDSVFTYRESLPVFFQIVANSLSRGNFDAFIDDAVFQCGSGTNLDIVKQYGFFYNRLIIDINSGKQDGIPDISAGDHNAAG